MWAPNNKNIVRATGTDEGGHAYSVGGIDLRTMHGRIDNSWGRDKWGVNGSAWVPLDDLFSLIFEQGGECILPRKISYDPYLLTVN
jgi:hypothetical protein